MKLADYQQCRICWGISREAYDAWRIKHDNTCSLWAHGIDCACGDDLEVCYDDEHRGV